MTTSNELITSFTLEVHNKFNAFEALANRSGVHPMDERRWMDFIVSVYEANLIISEQHIISILESKSFPAKLARELANTFIFGIELLQVKEDGVHYDINAKEDIST